MSSADCSFKVLASPAAGELLQSHNSLLFKLLKTVADFSQALATLHDRFGHELQMLVETFRKRNGELRKERLQCQNNLILNWEMFLQQVEVNSQQHGDIAKEFSQTSGNGLIERVFHRKIQSKKIFAHKERIEAILLKSNELLQKCHKDYCHAYALALANPAQHMSEYISSHNVYVHQLQATNGMVHAYQTKALPRLLEELEECHLDTSSNITGSVLSSSEFVAEKFHEQTDGYQRLALACRQTNHRSDLANLIKAIQSCAGSNHSTAALKALCNNNTDSSTNTESTGAGADAADGVDIVASVERRSAAIRYHQFQAPNWHDAPHECVQSVDTKNMQIVPTFKNEIAPDLSQAAISASGMAVDVSLQQQQPQLEKSRETLEERIERLEERIESMSKLLARSSESRLHNKVNELQEELCQRRFELYVAQLHLSAVRSQLQLFEYNFRPASVMIAGAAAAAAAINQSSGGGPSAVANHCQQQDDHDGHLMHQLAEQSGTAVHTAAPGAATATAQSASSLSLSATGVSRRSPTFGSAPLGYRNKWLKAFKSLRETSQQQQAQTGVAQAQCDADGSNLNLSRVGPSSTGSASTCTLQSSSSTLTSSTAAQQQQQQQQQQSQAENLHSFQEYTFKKIASCDVCKDFLRGHMRQGVKCKLCKISCHNDCQSKAHATIKCQQPKIKLLRRQKSAGELELNNTSDGNTTDGELQNERSTVSSKPDSIYQLIRQVLDAKKRGGSTSSHSNAAQQHNNNYHLDGTLAFSSAQNNQLRLANSAAINLSTGNLAQNGKSVSTSALGGKNVSAAAAYTSAQCTVDRWSVVMELLAQSRRKDDGVPGGGAADMAPGNGSDGKRHSKQLDKFKLAAKSAAVASKHQRYYLQQQQRQQQQPGASGNDAPAAPVSTSVSTPLHHAALAASSSTNLVGLGAGGGGYGGGPIGSGGVPGAARLQPPLMDGPQQQQQYNTQQQQQQGHQPLHLHHTKSLPQPPTSGPVGSGTVAPLPPTHQLAQQYAYALSSHQRHQQQQQQQQQQTGAITSGQQHLLDIALQQTQSTSAPHSPQRKRFELRMKSFSLDSPESPSVIAGNGGAPGGSGGGSGGMCTPAAAASVHTYQPHQLQHPHHNQHPHPHALNQHHYQQQQQQQQLHLQHQPQQQLHHPHAGNSGAGDSSSDASWQQQPQQQQQQQDDQANSNSARSHQEQFGYGQGQMRFDEASADYLFARCSASQANSSNSAAAQHRHSYHNNPSYYQAADQHQFGSTGAGGFIDSGLFVGAGPGAAGGGIRGAHSQSVLNSVGVSAAPNKSSLVSNEYHYNLVEHHRQQQQRQSPQAAHASKQPSKSSAPTSTSGEQNPQQQQESQQQQKQQQQSEQQQQQQQQQATFVVLYDYVAQRADEIQLIAGQIVQLVDASERDWWKVVMLDGSNRVGYFPASYLAQLFQNERPLQVAQTIQVSDGENCDKLLRGQIVIHTGKQMDNFVTIRTITMDAADTASSCSINSLSNPQASMVNHHYIQCPEKYLLELIHET